MRWPWISHSRWLKPEGLMPPALDCPPSATATKFPRRGLRSRKTSTRMPVPSPRLPTVGWASKSRTPRSRGSSPRRSSFSNCFPGSRLKSSSTDRLCRACSTGENCFELLRGRTGFHVRIRCFWRCLWNCCASELALFVINLEIFLHFRNSKLEMFFSVLLAVLVSIFCCLLLSFGIFRDFEFWLCFIVAGSQYSLLKVCNSLNLGHPFIKMS